VRKEYTMATEYFDKKVYVVILDQVEKREIPFDKVPFWIDIQEKQCINAIGITDAAAAWLAKLGIPEGLAGFLIMRPISGGASTAMLTDIFASFGPDSPAGLAASVILASGDTFVYIISVYHGAAGIKKSHRTLAAALLVYVIGAAAAIFLCGRFFG
jgi:spore maturation protein SpmB